MSILQKLRAGIQKLMTGRRGADELSLALLIAGVVLSMISSIFRWGIVYWLSLALYIFALFRMFSRNIEKRYGENAAFLKLWHGKSAGLKQFLNRLKNMKKYKYFKCPQCQSRLRLPRGVGEVTVTCGKCRHAFKKKA